MRHRSKGGTSWVIEDFIEAKRAGTIEYSVFLRTDDAHYEQDLHVFEGILRSFKPIKAKQL